METGNFQAFPARVATSWRRICSLICTILIAPISYSKIVTLMPPISDPPSLQYQAPAGAHHPGLDNVGCYVYRVRLQYQAPNMVPTISDPTLFVWDYNIRPPPPPLFLFFLSFHAFARLPIGPRFLPLRGNGKDCYADKGIFRSTKISRPWLRDLPQSDIYNYLRTFWDGGCLLQ